MEVVKYMKFSDRLRRVMYGRYGTDQLNRLLLGITMVLLITSMFIRNPGFYGVALGILIISYYRMFSRNIAKRYEENQKYLSFRNRLVGWFKLRRLHLKQRKDYRFFKCPTCGQKVRVPKGKGMVQITCPKCRTAFNKRS